MVIDNIEREVMNIFITEKESVFRVSYILSKLDFSYLDKQHDVKFPTISIVKLYLFRLIKGIKNYEALKKYLIENESEAFELGFYKDEHDNLIIPPKRTYNHYLQTKITSNEKHELDLIAEKILYLATSNKIILDIEIVKKTIREKKKSHEREMRESVKLVKKLVYPQIDLKIKENGKFTGKDLLDVLVYVGNKRIYANGGAKTFKVVNPNANHPSGDLMMYHFSKFNSKTKLKEMFNKILDVIFDYCKRNYNVLRFRKLNIAYDIHDVPYYGKNINYTYGGKKEGIGTHKFFKFLTCSIVVAGKRFILDVTPMHPIDSLDKLIDDSLARVKGKIKIDNVYLDRGFDRVKIINVLKKHNVKFIMPKVRTLTVKSWFDISEGIESRVIHDFKIGTKNNEATVNLILVDGKDRVKHAFISNFDIAPCLAYRFYEWYSKRWGIETSYRNLEHDFRPKTTTTNYNIRLFYFLFSCCLYNLWILVNICIGLVLYGRIPDKPIITADMFAVLLYLVQVKYFDSGG